MKLNYYMKHDSIENFYVYGDVETLINSNSFFTTDRDIIVDTLSYLFDINPKFTDYTVIVWDVDFNNIEQLSDRLMKLEEHHMGIIDLARICGVSQFETLVRDAKEKVEQRKLFVEQKQKERKEKERKEAEEAERKKYEELKKKFEGK